MNVEELKNIKPELKKIMKNFDALIKSNIKTTKDVFEYEERLENIIPSESFIRAFDGWKKRTAEVLKKYREECKNGFGRSISEFIRKQQNYGLKTREFQSSWRVGPLKINFKPDQVSAQFLYNEHIVSKWAVFSDSDELGELFDHTLKKLAEKAIPDEFLSRVFDDAFQQAQFRGQADQSRAPIKDLWMETEVALYRLNKLTKGKCKISELPLWAYLYNLDRYRQVARNLAPDQRLSFEAGSQHEINRGLGLILNGLEADEDYKTFCYVKIGFGMACGFGVLKNVFSKIFSCGVIRP